MENELNTTHCTQTTESDSRPTEQHRLRERDYTFTVQYNRAYDWSLISLFFLVHVKLRSTLSRFGGADAIVMQSVVSEELFQGPYVAARVGFGPATLRTEGTKPYHWATMPHVYLTTHPYRRWHASTQHVYTQCALYIMVKVWLWSTFASMLFSVYVRLWQCSCFQWQCSFLP